MLRYLIIAIFVLQGIGAVTALYQVRKVDALLFNLSRPWKAKRWAMVLLLHAQIFGVFRTIFVNRVFDYMDLIYPTAILLFIVGLNVFDYLLVKDLKMVRVRLKSQV